MRAVLHDSFTTVVRWNLPLEPILPGFLRYKLELSGVGMACENTGPCVWQTGLRYGGPAGNCAGTFSSSPSTMQTALSTPQAAIYTSSLMTQPSSASSQERTTQSTGSSGLCRLMPNWTDILINVRKTKGMMVGFCRPTTMTTIIIAESRWVNHINTPVHSGLSDSGLLCKSQDQIQTCRSSIQFVCYISLGQTSRKLQKCWNTEFFWIKAKSTFVQSEIIKTFWPLMILMIFQNICCFFVTLC